MLAILLPAAGQSSRMRGTDKLLEDVNGAPCLQTMANRALKVSEQVFVMLRPEDPEREAALTGLNVKRVRVPDATDGMFASLRSGANALPEGISAFLILPSDMPGITANDIATLWAAFQTLRPKILQAGTSDGLPGHPILFDASFIAQFRALSGPDDSRNILRRNEKNLCIVPLSDDRARRDLDTPEDWATWRAENPLGIG